MKDNRIYLIHIRDCIQRIETNELSAKFKASGRSNFSAGLDSYEIGNVALILGKYPAMSPAVRAGAFTHEHLELLRS